MAEWRRKSPEELLRQAEAEEGLGRRGRLKVFLGYAGGVGKTARMLDEGRRRRERGEDVVVAALQLGPEEPGWAGERVAPLAGGGLDVPEILRRRPEVCLIDGLAYRNPAGRERWQEVEQLLRAGIAVVGTINLQYIAEYQERVERIRGRRVAESVPESFLLKADEIEVVDAPALDPQLGALREMALVLAAEVVDARLREYLRRQGLEASYGTQERVLVCMTPRSNAGLMLERGRRQAERFHGALLAVYVRQMGLTEADARQLERNLETARAAGAAVAELRGRDPVRAILEFARAQAVTQIFVGHSPRQGWRGYLRPNPVERLILGAGPIDVRVFPQEGAAWQGG